MLIEQVFPVRRGRAGWPASLPLCALVGPLLCFGCSLPDHQISPPRTIHQQRLEATQFDPYADNELGPEIVGARPRDFQRPAAEAVRARGFRDTRWAF